jgi:hypothetical protein
MADERDDQATQVGNQVVPEDSTQADSDGGESPASAQSAADSGPEAAGKTEGFYAAAQPSAEQQAAAPTPAPPSSEQRPPSSPAAADRQATDQHDDPFNEKPHVYAFGAFVGAFAFAQVLKRITGGGDD